EHQQRGGLRERFVLAPQVPLQRLDSLLLGATLALGPFPSKSLLGGVGGLLAPGLELRGVQPLPTQVGPEIGLREASGLHHGLDLLLWCPVLRSLRWRLFAAHVHYATRFTLPSRQRLLRHAHLLRKRHRTHCSAPGHPSHLAGPEGRRLRHLFSVPSAPFDISWVRSRGPDRGGNFPDTGGYDAIAGFRWAGVPRSGAPTGSWLGSNHVETSSIAFRRLRPRRTAPCRLTRRSESD